MEWTMCLSGGGMLLSERSLLLVVVAISRMAVWMSSNCCCARLKSRVMSVMYWWRVREPRRRCWDME
eukprot:8106221-Alexandrium_andersonii.AAC.1